MVQQVDEVSFKKPVDIGDLLRLKSRVLYTSAISESEVRANARYCIMFKATCMNSVG